MFSLTDVIVLFIILIFAIVGFARGFIKAIFGKLCWILGILGAIFFYKKLAVYMRKSLVQNEIVSDILCFLIIFVVIFLLVKIIQIIVERIFDGEIMIGLDRALGFFFGILEGFVVISAIIFALIYQPWFDLAAFFEDSRILTFLQTLIIKASESTKETSEEVLACIQYNFNFGVI